MTEHWNPFAGARKHNPKTKQVEPVGIRQDMFNFVDLLALKGSQTLAVQTTAKSGMSARFRKITGNLSPAELKNEKMVALVPIIRTYVEACFAAGWDIVIFGHESGKTEPAIQRVYPRNLAPPPKQIEAPF